MANAELEIAEAIVDSLKVFAAAQSPELEIAFPNKSFTPPGDGVTYLRISVLPAQPFQPAAGGDAWNRHAGFAQIDVFWKAGEGIKQPLALAENIAAHFKRGSNLTTASGYFVQVNRPPYILGETPSGDASRTMIPVRVYYIADVPNPA